jgi:hypothetical protein
MIRFLLPAVRGAVTDMNRNIRGSKMMKTAWFLVHVLLVVCAAAVAAAQPSYRQITVPDGGSISGTVRLLGVPPADLTEPVTKDGDYCGSAKTSPRLMVGRDAGVKNAVVWIEKIAEGKRIRSQGETVLRQKKCEYDPHVLILPCGEELEIVNDDPVLHNVHTYDLVSGSRSMFNIAQPVRGARTKVNPDHVKGSGAILATCDAGHPWMNAYIIRAPHPYYAVTDGSGRFRLDDVPPGTYTLSMWHEGVTTHAVRAGAPPSVEEPYLQSKQVVMQPYGEATINFTFSLRSDSSVK